MNIVIERPKSLKKILTFFIPVFIIIGAVGISAILVMAKPEPEKKDVVELARHIRAVVAHEGPVALTVKTQGTVEAWQAIDLVPQVSGQVVYVSERFVAGGIFKKGEVILRLDSRDYQYAVTSAQARVTESRQFLVRERAEADLARTEWAQLGHGEASDLTLRKPQLADAEAKLGAAEANLNVAKLALERTEIRAPFNGLLSSKNVDLGQYLTNGTNVGKLYSIDVVEVRLPMSNKDLAQFDIAGLKRGETQLDVTLTGRFADQESHWKGKIVRAEGLVDTKTRIMYVVARLSGDELLSVNGKYPITIGQFVAAEVEGRRYDAVFQLPRAVLRQGNQVLVVDKDDKLRTRMVKVVEANREFVVISEGLEDGDIVCKSQLGVNVDGLLVQFDLGEGDQS
ncbi:Membrane fusion protein of RND family multidrug efflux pump [hydrothermal vent metagenome]|uniref:Membrane fusion protein of RND family multidrug efflux pump n=1 Tax=hydrothermal vent metagenome TaxID=652676 RepID=A0A3B1AN70_9ZZZZ